MNLMSPKSKMRFPFLLFSFSFPPFPFFFFSFSFLFLSFPFFSFLFLLFKTYPSSCPSSLTSPILNGTLTPLVSEVCKGEMRREREERKRKRKRKRKGKRERERERERKRKGKGKRKERSLKKKNLTGYITGAKDVKKFDVDPRKCSDFETANLLWDLIGMMSGL